jgi:ATP-binding cassette, subfamily B, bacterial PglK
MNNNLLKMLACLWVKLNSHRRRQFIFLIVLMLVGAVAEVVSLGLVLPFIGVIISPAKVFSHPIVQDFSTSLSITTPEDLVLPLAVIFATAAVLAGMIRLLLLWASTKLANATGVELSVEIYRRALYQPYEVHISRNSSEILSGITLKTSGVVAAVLVQSLMFISSLILILSIFCTLIIINPTISLFTFAGLGIVYGLVTLSISKKLAQNSKNIASQQTRVVKVIQEGLGGIRDIILDGVQSVFLKSYSKSERMLRMSFASNTVISSSPKFVLEAFAMVLIAVLALFLSRDGDMSESLPMLGVLALGAQKLLPMLQQLYAAWAKIQGTRAGLVDTLKLLEQPINEYSFKTKTKVMQFNNSIRLENVRYQYSVEASCVLDNISLTINKGSRIGIVGTTGSGKSTLIDVIMGLLVPVNGKIYIDNSILDLENYQAWQKCVAHVPQTVYLSDSSLAENIAFGVERRNIDMTRVRNAARRAQIAEFIESKPEKYDTNVGERGVRLSGGQCQRIGIARALYKDASLLIFDEATSALDNQTERAVMDSINALGRDLTMIMIAHRLTTVKSCDIIVELEQGKIAGIGTYDQLIQNSDTFRQ